MIKNLLSRVTHGFRHDKRARKYLKQKGQSEQVGPDEIENTMKIQTPKKK